MAVVSSGCFDLDLGLDEAPTPSTLPTVAPSVPIARVDTDHSGPAVPTLVEEYTGRTLDDTEYTVRSDHSPGARFIDGRPAEVHHITELAADRDCDQLAGALEFWLDVFEQTPDEATGERASVFARSAYDSIAAIGCGGG